MLLLCYNEVINRIITHLTAVFIEYERRIVYLVILGTMLCLSQG